jgi:hypothetical protein
MGVRLLYGLIFKNFKGLICSRDYFGARSSLGHQPLAVVLQMPGNVNRDLASEARNSKTAPRTIIRKFPEKHLRVLVNGLSVQ